MSPSYFLFLAYVALFVDCNTASNCIDAIGTDRDWALTTTGIIQIAFNQGKVNGMEEWGHSDGKIGYLRWKSNASTKNISFGYVEGNKCKSFNLKENDYINGYRLIYSQDSSDTLNSYYVNGLAFHTQNGHTLECMADDINVTSGDFIDTGDIYYNYSYLSGIAGQSHKYISSLEFQFTTTICNQDIDKSAVCVYNDDSPQSTGIYEWSHFDPTMNVSVYYCDQCDFNYCELKDCEHSGIFLALINDYRDCHIWIFTADYNDYSHYATDNSRFGVCKLCGKYPYNASPVSCNGWPSAISIAKCNNISQPIFDESITGDIGNIINIELGTWTYYYVMGGIVFVFVVFGIPSLCCCHKNDYFHFSKLIAPLIQILDMMSDVFFVIDVWSHCNILSEYQCDNRLQFILIFGLSVISIIIPLCISLYQLHAATSKYWLYDNRIREWLLEYSNYLYLTSIITGSPFAAVLIFNSNLFGLDCFYMGLSKQYLLSFSTKKIYSIVAFENCPQLILSGWYSILLQKLNFVPFSQMIFSLISIFVTFVTMILRKRIYETQDYVHITIDIKGQCIIDNIKICRNRIRNIKSFLCTSVFGISWNSIEIKKPFIGGFPNGLRLQINICYIHDDDPNNINIYNDLLQKVIDDGSFQKIINKEWRLESLPEIGNMSSQFMVSKEKKHLNELTLAITKQSTQIYQESMGIKEDIDINKNYKSECQQCYKITTLGRIDENDQFFYCHQCYNEFYN